MKKTIVALAAAAATASFAQVTITGNFDFAYVTKSGTLARANGSTVTTGTGTSSTSTIKLTATEDLGGGLKVTGLYELDPRTLSDDSMALTHSNSGAGSSTGTVGTNSVLTGLARGEAYIQLSGAAGTLQLGAPNSFGLGTVGTASALGTGVGSGYTFNGTSGSGMNSFVQTRYSRSVKVTSANMNGFTAGIQYAPGNDQTGAGSSTALSIPNARQATELNLSYSKGPLNVSFTNVAQAAQTNATGWYATGANTMASTSANVLAANYNIGALTVYAGTWSGNGLLATTIATAVGGHRGALKYNMGKVDLIGQYQEVKTNNGQAETKATVTGARLDYNLSKTAAAYLGYEKYDSGATASNNMDIISIGLRKAF